jgi:hypothetical protein
VLLPANTGDTASMVAQALTVFERLRDGKEASGSSITPGKGPWKG